MGVIEGTEHRKLLRVDPAEPRLQEFAAQSGQSVGEESGAVSSRTRTRQGGEEGLRVDVGAPSVDSGAGVQNSEKIDEIDLHGTDGMDLLANGSGNVKQTSSTKAAPKLDTIVEDGVEKWKCSACTYHNELGLQFCAICNGHRELPVDCVWDENNDAMLPSRGETHVSVDDLDLPGTSGGRSRPIGPQPEAFYNHGASKTLDNGDLMRSDIGGTSTPRQEPNNTTSSSSSSSVAEGVSREPQRNALDEAKLQEEWHDWETAPFAVLAAEIDAEVAKGIRPDWYKGSLAFKGALEHMGDAGAGDDFVLSSFDPLLAHYLDTGNDDVDADRSWHALNKMWEKLDEGLVKKYPPIKEEEEESEDHQTGNEKEATSTKQGDGGGNPAVESGKVIIAPKMRKAFETVILTSVKIVVKTLRSNKMEKISQLSALLDPKTRRYHHLSYFYNTSSIGWNSGSNIGAPDLHNKAFDAFVSEDGCSVLAGLVKDRESDPKLMLEICSIYSKNEDILKENHPKWVQELLENACSALLRWELTAIMEAPTVYTKIVELLSDLADDTPLKHEVRDVAITLAMRFVRSDKLHFRRFGLEQLGSLSLSLTSRRKISEEDLTTLFKNVGLYQEVFGDRMDERVVSCSEDILRRNTIDKEILNLMLRHTNSRAVRKMCSSLAIQFSFQEGLTVHLIFSATCKVIRKADPGALELILGILGGEQHARQAIVRKGEKSMKASLGALWSVLFSDSVLAPVHRWQKKAPVSAAGSDMSPRFERGSPIFGKGVEETSQKSNVVTISSLLNVPGRLDNLLNVFQRVAKDCPADLRIDFANRALDIIETGLLLLKRRGSESNLASRVPSRHDGGDSPEIFQADEEMESTLETSFRAHRVTTDEVKMSIGGLQVTFVSDESVLIAYRILKSLIFSIPANERSTFIAILVNAREVKELLLEEFEMFLALSVIRVRMDRTSDQRTNSLENLFPAGRLTSPRFSLGAESDISIDAGYGSEANEAAELVHHTEIRLQTLAQMIKHGITQMAWTQEDLYRLWKSCCMPIGDENNGNYTTQEAFMIWLRHTPLTKSGTLWSYVLTELFQKHIDVTRMGPKTYHCLQAKFVKVNHDEKLFDAEDSDAVSREFVFESRSPPKGLEGTALVGRVVSVLFQNERMTKGKIKKYNPWTNCHKIDYQNSVNTVEEKELENLKKWCLIPLNDNAMAGPVSLHQVGMSEPPGLDTIWSVALRCELRVVATQGFNLLLNFYSQIYLQSLSEKADFEEIGELFTEKLFTELENDKSVVVRSRFLQYLPVYMRKLDLVTEPPLGPSPLKNLGYGDNVFLVLDTESDRIFNSLQNGVRTHTKIPIAQIIWDFASFANVSRSEVGLSFPCNSEAPLSAPPSLQEFDYESAHGITLEDIGITGIAPTKMKIVRIGTPSRFESSTPRFNEARPADHMERSGLEMVEYDPSTIQRSNKEKVNSTSSSSPSTSSEVFNLDDSDLDIENEEGAAFSILPPQVLRMQDLRLYGASPAGCLCCNTERIALLRAMVNLIMNSYHEEERLMEENLFSEESLLESLKFLDTLPPFLEDVRALLVPTNHKPHETVENLQNLLQNKLESREASFWDLLQFFKTISSLVVFKDLASEIPSPHRGGVGWPINTNADEVEPYTWNDVKFSDFVTREVLFSRDGSSKILHALEELLRRAEEKSVLHAVVPGTARLLKACVMDLLHRGNAEPRRGLKTANLLFHTIMKIREELESRNREDSSLPCNCQRTFLGVPVAMQLSPPKNENPTETEARSRNPPLIDPDLLDLKPHVCDVCLNSRELLRALLHLMNSFEALLGEIPLIGEKFLKESRSKVDTMVDHLILNCSIPELRKETCQALMRLARGSQNYFKTVAGCVRAAELELEKQRHSESCGDFFTLFQSFVPDSAPEASEEDCQLVERLIKLVLGWPDRPPIQQEGREAAETNLFVGFATALSAILERDEGLLELVRSAHGRNLREILWGRFLMGTPPGYYSTQGRPVCESVASRAAVKRLLCALTKNDLDEAKKLTAMVEEFSSATPMPMMHSSTRSLVADWEYDPLPNGNATIFKGRNVTGHVGLLNRGSTCYINSLLQLLFHIPSFREAVVNSPVPPPESLLQDKQSEEEQLQEQQQQEQAREQRIVVGWVCICSGINDLSATNCHICASMKSPDAEMVTESYNFGSPVGASGNESSRQCEVASLEVLRQLQRAFRFLRDGEVGCYDPRPFVDACAVLNLQFPVTSQNDASEFYDKLLDNLERCLKGSPALKVMNECFLGQQTKLKRCHTCGKATTSREETFYRLELMTKDNSQERHNLEECLDSLVAPEIMTGDNRVDCEQCQSRMPCTFVSCVTTLPRYLFVHPTRFSFDLTTIQVVKLNHRITFPLQLDMFPYTREGLAVEASKLDKVTAGSLEEDSEEANAATASRFDAASFLGGDRAAAIDEMDFREHRANSQYKLSGVLIHRGRAGGGHYTSIKFIKPEELPSEKSQHHAGEGSRTLFNSPTHGWFYFNDSNVSVFDPEASKGGLEDECFGGTYRRTTSTSFGTVKTETLEKENSAFMLLYEKMDPEEAEEAASKVVDGLHTEGNARSRISSLGRRSSSPFSVGSPNFEGLALSSRGGAKRGSIPSSRKGRKVIPKVSVDKEMSSSMKTRNPLSSGATSLSFKMQRTASLKETTLSGLIVSHKSWHTSRFNGLLDEEIEVANRTYRRHAVLFDRIILSIAHEVLDSVLRIGPIQDASLEYIFLSSLRIFEQVTIRSDLPVRDLQSWAECMVESMKRGMTIAMLFIQELCTKTPLFSKKADEDVVALIEAERQQVERLQEHSAAMESIGDALFSVRGIIPQILDCSHGPSFDAMLLVLAAAVDSICTEPSIGANEVSRLLQSLLHVCDFAGTHSRLLERFGRIWAALVESRNEVVLRMATSLDAVAHLVNLILGASSPAKEIRIKGLVTSRLPVAELGIPEGSAVPNISPIATALEFLITAPMRSDFDTLMLRHEELHKKLLDMHGFGHDVQRLIVQLSAEDDMDAFSVLDICLKTMRENAGCIAYAHSETSSARAIKATQAQSLARMLGQSLRFDDQIGTFLEIIIDRIYEEFRCRNVDDGLSRLDLAVAQVKKWIHGIPEFGLPQFTIMSMEVFRGVGEAHEDFMISWADTNLPSWGPILKLLEKVVPPKAPKPINGFDSVEVHEMIISLRKFVPEGSEEVADVEVEANDDHSRQQQEKKYSQVQEDEEDCENEADDEKEDDDEEEIETGVMEENGKKPRNIFNDSYYDEI